VFFTRSLLGIIVAIVWYLLMYMVIALVNGNSSVPKSALWGASISSHAALSFSFDVMASFEA
jgi:ATP-binding cassette subfamily A (ABC1) protein 3